jgi:glycosyltransferase involved in cell wall biosynthesis
MICLSLIARDEARCIARCLQSAAPFVDAMVVVDTGSIDATADIARAHGARVLSFPWCEDFSAARNFALQQSDADWHLVLDADEWIEREGACLRACAAAATGPFVGQVNVRSGYDDGATVRHAGNWISRFLPRGVRYQGRIHEQVIHHLPVRRLALVIGHDGYRHAQQAIKGDRNERLLRRIVQERPDDPYAHYQLGKDLEIHGRHAEAVAAYACARARVPWPPSVAGDAAVLQARHPWLHDLAVRGIYCLRRARRYADALAWFETEQAYWTQSPDLYFACGDMLLDHAIAEPARAAHFLERMEACWLRCLALGEAPQLEGAVEGRGSFLAAHNLAVMYGLTGDEPRAARYRELARARPPDPGGTAPGDAGSAGNAIEKSQNPRDGSRS